MILAAAVVLTAACGGRAIRLPTDTGTALPEFSTIHADVTRTCRSRSMSASYLLGISAPLSLTSEGHSDGTTVSR